MRLPRRQDTKDNSYELRIYIMKWLLRIGLALVVLVIAAVVGVGIYLDNIVHSAAEYGATYALGVDTTIDDLNVRPIAGRLELDTLDIPNPQGFDTPRFLKLDNASVQVAVGSLTSEHVSIPSLTLSGIHLHLERKGKTANYNVILDNLKKFESEDTPPTTDKQTQKFTINDLVLRDIHVQADLTNLGQLTRVPIDIDEIHLKNVGSESDTASLAAQLTDTITKALLAGIAKKAGGLLPADIGKELVKGLGQLQQVAGLAGQVANLSVQELDKAAKQVGKTLEGAGKQLEGLGKGMDQVGKGIGKGVDKVGKDIGKGLDQVGKDIGKGLGGLLGGNKKKVEVEVEAEEAEEEENEEEE